MFDTIETHEQFSASHVAPYPLTITRAEGIMVFDVCGKSYIDMASGVSVVNFGHGHPRLIQALIAQANKVAIVPRLFHNEPLSKLLKSACEMFEMDKAIPMNSGAEAVETAIKLARKWAYSIKNIQNNRAEIIVCDNSFHGRTITTVSLSSICKYKNNFGPLTPGFISIPFNDVSALEKAISPNTAAFLVEPIQGEAGVILPDKNYLKKCEEICKKNNVVFIVDEIQTGIGRTGKPLAVQHDNIHPDGLLLGKSLGGGLLPISLFLGKSALMNVIQAGEHGSTFGGNPLASAVAYESLQVLKEEKIAENAAQMGEYFLDELKKIQSPLIAEVRGKGLLLAIELNTNIQTSRAVFERLIKNGLLCIDTRNKVLRLLPPLIITKNQIDDAVNIIRGVIERKPIYEKD